MGFAKEAVPNPNEFLKAHEKDFKYPEPTSNNPSLPNCILEKQQTYISTCCFHNNQLLMNIYK